MHASTKLYESRPGSGRHAPRRFATMYGALRVRTVSGGYPGNERPCGRLMRCRANNRGRAHPFLIAKTGLQLSARSLGG